MVRVVRQCHSSRVIRQHERRDVGGQSAVLVLLLARLVRASHDEPSAAQQRYQHNTLTTSGTTAGRSAATERHRSVSRLSVTNFPRCTVRCGSIGAAAVRTNVPTAQEPFYLFLPSLLWQVVKQQHTGLSNNDTAY